MAAAVTFDEARNEALSGGENLVFHCHYYNCTLQRAILDGLGPERGARVTEAAAAEAARLQLSVLYKESSEKDPKKRLLRAAEIYKESGFGLLDFSKVTARGGEILATSSHYAMGWASLYGESKVPVCHFVVGFVCGAMTTAFDLAPERVHAKETRCFAMGSNDCLIAVEVR